MFFTAPDVRQSRSGRSSIRSGQTQKYGVQNTWKVLKHTGYWCNLKLAQRKGFQFSQTRSKAIALFNTLLAMCIEKVVHMKTGEDLYSKVHHTPKLPCVVLPSNLQHGRQNPLNLEARKSTGHHSEHSVHCRETCRPLPEGTGRKHPEESQRDM